MLKMAKRLLLRNGLYFWVKGHERCLKKLGLEHLSRGAGMTNAQIIEDFLDYYKISPDDCSKELGIHHYKQANKDYLKEL